MTKKIKLTPPQQDALALAARPCGMHVDDRYPPTRKLLELGLATVTPQRMSSPLFRATEAGRAWLDARVQASEAADTLLLSSLLESSAHMLSRYRLRQLGVTDEIIDAAAEREEVVVDDGEALASVILTAHGMAALARKSRGKSEGDAVRMEPSPC